MSDESWFMLLLFYTGLSEFRLEIPVTDSSGSISHYRIRCEKSFEMGFKRPLLVTGQKFARNRLEVYL